MENATKLPNYLDIHQKLKVPTALEESNTTEWALFRDNDGRVLAQRSELVEKEESYTESLQDCNKEPAESTNTRNDPEYILVVSGDFAQENAYTNPMPNCNNILNNIQGTAQGHDECHPCSIINSVVNEKWNASNGNGILPIRFQACESEFFPCIRRQWYIRHPLAEGVLIDDAAIVNTAILANDVRVFLKNNSISLEKFAKLHMNRTQGTVSDLLNHPKKWHELSRKGRDAYIKFMEFLSDIDLPRNIKLLRSKNSFICPNRLPSSFLKQLQEGIQPTEREISNAAVVCQIKCEMLRRYCHQQLALRDKFKLNEFSHPEEHVSDILGQVICGKPGCGTIMQGNPALNVHLEKNCESQYYCSLCKNYFKTNLSFDSHFQDCHEPFMACTRPPLLENMDDMIERDALFVGDGNDLVKQKFICCECWCGFKSRQRLMKHLSAKHKVVQRDLRPGVTCFICLKVLKNLNALNVHVRKHTNARPFRCDVCSSAFQTKANLQRHIKTHTGEKPYACTYCAARFIEEKALVIHLRTHTGEKPFKCSVCNKCFVHKAPLKLHMLIHEGKKPHSCDICGKHFRQKINLKVHMKRHSGVKKHKCTTCGLSFLTKTDWNRHNMMHTGEKPFQCHLCSKTFTRNSYLRDHLERLKTYTTPQCEICEKKLCNDAALKRHRKSHNVLPHADVLEDQKGEKETITLDTFQYPDGVPSNANMLLLSTKSNESNDKQYFVTPVQAAEGSSDEINRLSLQSVMLSHSDDGYSIPITGIDGQPLFLQCVDLSGNSIPLFGSNGELLSSLKDIAIPITFTTSEENGNHNLPSASDPNMQSTISKSLDDSGILTENIHGDHTIELDLSGEQSHLIVSESQQITDTAVVVIPQHQHESKANEIPVPKNHVSHNVEDVILAETHRPEIAVPACGNSSNQTFLADS